MVSPKQLDAFKPSRSGFHVNTERAGKEGKDTFLFHGCPPDAMTNISAEGLQLKFVGKNGTMLGAGLYGAPDPRKSASYAGKHSMGKFLFICRFNLSGAEHAGPDTKHKNEIYHEYCTPDESKVVVLWQLKVEYSS